jgi:hypothetical protein
MKLLRSYTTIRRFALLVVAFVMTCITSYFGIRSGDG